MARGRRAFFTERPSYISCPEGARRVIYGAPVGVSRQKVLGEGRRCNAVLLCGFCLRRRIHATIPAALRAVVSLPVFATRFRAFFAQSIFIVTHNCLCVAFLFWSPTTSRSR